MATITVKDASGSNQAVELPLAPGQAAMSASRPVVIASNQSAVAISQVAQTYGGTGVTVTRPANTTAYAAGDVVGGAITFASMAPAAGVIWISSAALEIDVTAIPSGMTSFRLYLYSVTPPSGLGDNAAFDLPSGDRASFLGFINLGTPEDLGSTLYAQADNIGHPIRAAGTAIYGYLVTAGGFTPAANSEVYKLTLHSVSL
jgi:hypothetical protein